MMTVGSRESVSTPQGVGIKPTGPTFAPIRRVGVSTFPLATDPVSTAISESLSHFGLAADFCSRSVSNFLKSSRSRSGSRAPAMRQSWMYMLSSPSTDFLSRAIAWAAWAFPSAADTPVPSCPARPASAAWEQAMVKVA